MSYKNHKRKMVDLMGGKCVCCGYNKCIEALEFHHLHPEEKLFTISGHYVALSRLIPELQKCILVCANCHREIHNGMIISDNFISSFDKEKFQELEKEKSQVKLCKNCGKEISSKATLCIACAHILQQKVEHPDRETLKFQVRNMSMSAVSRIYNVSDNAIRKWCKKYLLPSCKKDINKYTDEEWAKI